MADDIKPRSGGSFGRLEVNKLVPRPTAVNTAENRIIMGEDGDVITFAAGTIVEGLEYATTGNPPDLTDYYNKEDVDSLLGDKEDSATGDTHALQADMEALDALDIAAVPAGVTSDRFLVQDGNDITQEADIQTVSGAIAYNLELTRQIGDAIIDGGGAYVKRDGDTMTGDLDMGSHKIITDTVELTGNRSIDVEDGFAGFLSYDGANRIEWGNDIRFDSDVNFRDHRLINLPEPVDDDNAATKRYVDDSVGSLKRLGREFKYATGGKASTSYLPGDLFFTTENNVAYTTLFADARYVCFAWEDFNGMIWRTARVGSITLPPGQIIIEYHEKMMGWFDYEGGTAAITDGSQTGSVVIPVTGWHSTTGADHATSDVNYLLITQFWN